MPDPRSPKESERIKFADRNKTAVSSLDARQPKTSLRFLVPDDGVTNDTSKFGSKKVYICCI